MKIHSILQLDKPTISL